MTTGMTIYGAHRAAAMAVAAPSQADQAKLAALVTQAGPESETDEATARRAAQEVHYYLHVVSKSN